jgi:hypothetical protein
MAGKKIFNVLFKMLWAINEIMLQIYEECSTTVRNFHKILIGKPERRRQKMKTSVGGRRI